MITSEAEEEKHAHKTNQCDLNQQQVWFHTVTLDIQTQRLNTRQNTYQHEMALSDVFKLVGQTL